MGVGKKSISVSNAHSDKVPPNMKVVDLFAGVGGLSLGFEKAGFEIISSYDNWPVATETNKLNFPGQRVVLIDLNEMVTAHHPEIVFLRKARPDIIVGGPPCQDFSSAGKRAGNGDRGNLTPVFAKIASLVRPEWVVMENVNTIVSIGHDLLAECTEILRRSGYGLTLEVLNSADYGVPQNRKRLFLVGRLNGVDGEMKYPLLESRSPRITVRQYMPEIATGPNAAVYYYRHPRSYSRRGVFSIDEVSPTIRGVNRPMPKTYVFHKNDMTDDRHRVRPLSFEERARVQTFPKNFIWTGTRSEREQMVGNAVPPELACSLALTIRRFKTGGLRRFIAPERCDSVPA